MLLFRKYWPALAVALTMLGVMVVLAFTDMSKPLVEFIHSQGITPLQAFGCFGGGLVVFYLVYKLLVKLGKIFLPRDSA